MGALARWTAVAGMALAILVRAPAAVAQPVAPPAAPSMTEARAHFEKGVEWLQHDAWDAALSEFLRSRALYPTVKATTNAVICLRQIGRDDEALDLLEALLRASPDLAAEKRAAVEREVADLLTIVGTLAIEGGGPGATIEIDGRVRGTLPAAGPLHVKAGSHLVRALAEGASPFEARVEVAAGQTVSLVPVLRPLPAPPPPAPPPIAPPAPRAALPAALPGPQQGGSYAPAVIALGAGGGGLVLGAVIGAVSLGEASHVKSQCDGTTCPVSALGEANTSRMLGNVSTAAFIAGGVAAATGVVLLVVRLRGGSRAAAPFHAVQWDTRIGLGHAELGGSF